MTRPFEQESGWRRRTWQDPAAIPTTITHEETIMTDTTLRLRCTEARSISIAVLASRAGGWR